MQEPIPLNQGGWTLPELPAGFRWSMEDSSATLTCDSLLPWTHGWTTRSLELSGVDEGRTAGWTRLSARCGVAPDAVIRLRQVHGSAVLHAGADLEARPVGDGLLSRDADTLLTVAVADCVPLLIGDRLSGAVGAVHAGWRGTSEGIARRAVERLVELFDSRPSDLIAAIGPSIGPCCYEVGPELLESFRVLGWPESRLRSWFDGRSRPHLDLWAANRDQLVETGVPPASIAVARMCTACQTSVFHSFRCDGSRAGRMVGFIRAAQPPRP